VNVPRPAREEGSGGLERALVEVLSLIRTGFGESITISSCPFAWEYPLSTIPRIAMRIRLVLFSGISDPPKADFAIFEGSVEVAAVGLKRGDDTPSPLFFKGVTPPSAAQSGIEVCSKTPARTI
jgi:hypothetical protein